MTKLYSEYPRDPANGRPLCTPKLPAPYNPQGQWSHTGAYITGENYEGDCDRYRCKDCHVTWQVCYEG